jgi:hypothetical protein
MGTGRKLVAAVCALAPASLIVYGGPRPIAIAYAVLLALAGVGLGRRSITAQVLSRGVMWSALIPGTLAVLATLTGGRLPSPLMVALAAGAGASLLLARPMLHTGSARSAFDPLRFRGWLLAGATSAVTVAVMLAGIGAQILRHGHASGVLVLSVAAAYVAAAIGVARMRAWGILLAGLTSVSAFFAQFVFHDARSMVAAIAAVPGLLLCLPILAARYGSRPRVEEVRTRVALPVEAASERERESEAVSRRATGIPLP